MPHPAQASQPTGIYPDGSPTLRPEHESDLLPSAVPRASMAGPSSATLEGLSTSLSSEPVSAAGAARGFGLTARSVAATAQQDSVGLPPFVLGPLPPTPHERKQWGQGIIIGHAAPAA